MLALALTTTLLLGSPAPPPPFVQCLQAHCDAQDKACLADKTCSSVVNCVVACGQSSTCAKKCLQVPLDGAMLALASCAQTNKCLPSDEIEESANATCDKLADKDSCDKAGCSWCKAGAVPDSCKTIDEAKALPYPVFDCDNISK